MYTLDWSFVLIFISKSYELIVQIKKRNSLEMLANMKAISAFE